MSPVKLSLGTSSNAVRLYLISRSSAANVAFDSATKRPRDGLTCFRSR